MRGQIIKLLKSFVLQFKWRIQDLCKKLAEKHSFKKWLIDAKDHHEQREENTENENRWGRLFRVRLEFVPFILWVYVTLQRIVGKENSLNSFLRIIEIPCTPNLKQIRGGFGPSCYEVDKPFSQCYWAWVMIFAHPITPLRDIACTWIEKTLPLKINNWHSKESFVFERKGNTPTMTLIFSTSPTSFIFGWYL